MIDLLVVVVLNYRSVGSVTPGSEAFKPSFRPSVTADKNQHKAFRRPRPHVIDLFFEA
jgi:hypothetical protein